MATRFSKEKGGKGDMKSNGNFRRPVIFNVAVATLMILALFASLPSVHATLTSNAGDDWADVEMAWFAKTRHGGAGGFRASVGIDPTTSSGQNGWFPGGWKWVSGTSYHFIVDYDATAESAELYVIGQNSGNPLCQYNVGPSQGKIGINARTAPETGMTTTIENVQFNSVPVTPDSSVTATSVSGESAVRHLLITGADLTSDFTLEGDFTFVYGSSTSDERPSMVINFENKEPCVPDVPVNPGYDPDAVCSAGARWRNFRTDGNGWELAVGDPSVIGSYNPGWSNLDFVYAGDYFFSPAGPNIFTFTYDATSGDQTIEADVNGGLFTKTQNNGNLGTLNYVQFDVVGRSGQTVQFNNVILTVDSVNYDLCSYEAGGWNTWYIDSLDLTNGFSLTGEVILLGQATGDEMSKINLCAGTSGCTPVCKNVEDDIEYCTIQEAIDATTTDDGETIEVYAGTHPGNIIVYKKLTIQSQAGAASTIIDANVVDYSSYQNAWGKGINYAWAETYDLGLLKNGFMIWSDDVTIDGFTISNAAWPAQYNRGIGILIGSIHTTYAGFIPWNIDQWGGIVPNPDEPTPTGIVIKNNIIDAPSDGIYNWASSGNIMEYNTISNTDPLGGTGIQCYEGGTDNIIRGNNIDNAADAICVAGAWPDVLLDVSNTQVYENTLTNNAVGIKFYNIAGSGVVAHDNDIYDNGKGILVEGAGGALVAIAYCNNIVGNTLGVENAAPDGIFDAECNWWGDCSGPSTVGPGSGDSVSTMVDYEPWVGAVADAGGPYIDDNCDSTLTFDGSGSMAAVCCGGTVSYQWDFGDGEMGTGINPMHTYDEFGEFTVTLTVTVDALGHHCVDTDTASVTVYGVHADAGGPYQIRNTYRTVHFDGTASTGYQPPLTYDWDFGDGTGWHYDIGATPTYTYPIARTYTVQLRVTESGNGCSDIDTTKVSVTDTDPPIIDLAYPEGGEILSGTVTVKWFAIDEDHPQGEGLRIYLYYSGNDGDTWVQVEDIHYNNVDYDRGSYEWNTAKLLDGTYMLKAEAVDKYDNINLDTSDPFTIDNGNAEIQVAAKITDITIGSTKWVKDGDSITITATITGNDAAAIRQEDLTADLSNFGLAVQQPDIYSEGTATWTLEDVTCTPSDGQLLVAFYIDNIYANSVKITADNTQPDIILLKPAKGLYLGNLRIIPFGKTIIIGALQVQIQGSDINGIDHAEIYMDDILLETINEEPYFWHMNIKSMGPHTLTTIIYDHAGNTQTTMNDITIINPNGLDW